MSSNKFLRKAKEIKNRDKEFFDSLMEFEKTGKMSTKTRLNFTIDKVTAEKFRKYCKNNGYNMSAKLEQSMINMMKKI